LSPWGTLSEVASRNRLGFRIDLARDQASSVWQGFGHHESAVSREHSELEDGSGVGQPDQHFKKATFDRIDLHLRPLHHSIGFIPKTDIQVRFGFRVIASKLFDRHIDEALHIGDQG
jgi:hypothetical protein